MSYTQGLLTGRTETDVPSGESRSWSYSYVSSGPAQGLIHTVDGPRTDVADITTYDYYPSDDPGGAYRAGDLWKVTDALGHVIETLAYDGAGRPLQIRDPNGVDTVLVYDPRGRLSSRTVAAGTAEAATTGFSYTPSGQLDRVTLADGSHLDYDYDDAQRLTDIYDSLGDHIHYTLDDAGNRTEEQTYDPAATLKRRVSRVYDELSRLYQVVGNHNQRTQLDYDPNGNLTQRTEALGDPQLERSTEYHYDALDRLIDQIDPYNGPSMPTEYGYDPLDQLTSVTDPEGLATVYGRNALGDLKQQQSPDTGLTAETYDGAGNLKTRTDARGITVIYSYDALNRLTTVDYLDDSLDVGYSYDQGTNGIGRLTGMTDASGSTVYGYDARGNLTSVSHTVLGQVYLTQYGYDSADRRIRVTYPSGRVVDTPRDSAGRISGVSTTYEGLTQTLASDLAYDPFGPLKSFTYGNGVSRSVDYDLDGRIEAVESDPVQSLDYTYNILDQLTDLTDLGLTGLDQSFGYDVLDRLTSASGGYGSQDFGYDGVGNRLTLTAAAGTDTYGYNPGSNRLASISGPHADTRSYDEAGNTTALVAYDLDYGDDNRLRAARLGSTTLAEYTYDGNGERVIKAEGAQSTVYHYDLQGRLIAETDAQGQTLREYIYLLGEPLAAVLPIAAPASQCTGTDPVITGEFVASGQTYYCQASGSITTDDNGLEVDTDGQAVLSAPSAVLRSGLRIVLGGAFAVGPEAAPPSQALHYIHPDHLGTPRLVTDGNQTIVWRWDSTPFGESAPNEDPDGDGQSVVLNLRFPGQYYDQETGLNYNYRRYYDPSIGRYLTADPILGVMLVDYIVSRGEISTPMLMQVPIYKEVPQNFHSYMYVYQNPIEYRDPLGLEVSPRCDTPPKYPCGYDGPRDDPYYSESCCIERCWSYWKCDRWWHYIGIVTPVFCLGNGIGCIASCKGNPGSY